jgi:hypothetical protein
VSRTNVGQAAGERKAIVAIRRTEHLYCLHDAGPIESIGRFETRIAERIEIGMCRFDAAISGFRWDEDAGWQPVFIQHHDWTNDRSVITLIKDDEPSPYTEEEIAFELACFFDERRSLGLG